MQHLIICFLVLFATVTLSAQNVGIHNTAPQAPLHINEPANTLLISGTPIVLGSYTGNNTQDVIGVQGISRPSDYYGIGGSFEGGWRGIEGLVRPTGNLFYTGVHGEVLGGTGINYAIYGSATGGTTNYAGYFADGNVYLQNRLGIGQPAPAWPLDMSTTQAVARMTTTSSGNGSVLELQNSTPGSAFLGAINFNNNVNSYPGQIAYETTDKMTFRVAGSNRFSINSQEIVGVPKGRFLNGLEAWNLVTGNPVNIALMGVAAGAVTNWAGYFSAGNVYVADELRVGSETGAAGYKVSVTGKMMCEELRVQLQADWPDYVFADNYPLLTLEDLEHTIISTGHLPGIPSAKEIQSNGFEVGEMQRRLVEKIEELTLYVIQLNQEIRALQSNSKNQ